VSGNVNTTNRSRRFSRLRLFIEKLDEGLEKSLRQAVSKPF
jgi:hypothetical protein